MALLVAVKKMLNPCEVVPCQVPAGPAGVGVGSLRTSGRYASWLALVSDLSELPAAAPLCSPTITRDSTRTTAPSVMRRLRYERIQSLLQTMLLHGQAFRRMGRIQPRSQSARRLCFLNDRGSRPHVC